jgi:diguanylate cyclase
MKMPASQFPAPGLSWRDLGLLMPLFVAVDTDGRVRAAGPTLRKLAGGEAVGRSLDQVFTFQHPPAMGRVQDLTSVVPLRLSLSGTPSTPFKGIAIPLAASDGVLINLSFGATLRDAVHDHGLTDTDFAVTDLASELLFLAEAKAAVMTQAQKFSDRIRSARAQAVEQSLTDPLTGLRNRRGLDRMLARLTGAGQPFGVIHVDLDHFKQINDTLGHAMGDEVLVSVGARLRNAVRDDDSVARIGGDEFLVVLPGVRDCRQVDLVARRLLDDLARPVRHDNPQVVVTASLGVAVWDGSSRTSIDALLLDADRALYQAKDAGRGRVHFADGAVRAGGGAA